MGKIWMPGGGGGADLDVVTAERPDVLTGKVIVDKEGEPLTGTMPNRGAVNQTLNAGGSYSIPEGYHNGSGKVTANSLASQTSGNADSGSILSGRNAWVNGNKVTGSIPLQNPEIANTDQMWAQNYENWGDGNYFLGVRNGHYLNGINWVRGYNANFVAANIKKGVNVAGVMGTFEGYVATATDWYYMGTNQAGFKDSSYFTFESNQIRFSRGNDYGTSTTDLIATNSYNLTGYNYLDITLSEVIIHGTRASISLVAGSFTGTMPLSSGNSTVRIPLTSANLTAVPRIRMSQTGGGPLTVCITRMRLT